MTPEQEAGMIREFGKMGPTQLWERLKNGGISLPFHSLANRWLADKERESERRKEASQAEQIEIARSAAEAAWEAARAARNANKIATAAIVAAAIAIIISVFSLFGWHPH